MTLAKDLSHLPTPARTSDTGQPPDPEPRFAPVLVEAWRAENAAAGELPRAHPDARFRHSDAGKCARAVAYAALDVPSSNPMDLSGVFNTHLGKMIHAAWQEALQARFPGCEIELRVHEGERAGHIDAVIRFPDGQVVAIELKTVGGFAFKLAVGERGEPQGPKAEHVVQAALNAAAVDADEAVVAYLAKESISVQAAERNRIGELGRFAAEWTFPRDLYEPIAAAEVTRVRGILGLVAQGQLPARKIPDLPAGAVITDPATGSWRTHDTEGKILDAGTFWMCLYCRWQDVCQATATGRQPISEVAVALGLESEAS